MARLDTWLAPSRRVLLYQLGSHGAVRVHNATSHEPLPVHVWGPVIFLPFCSAYSGCKQDTATYVLPRSRRTRRDMAPVVIDGDENEPAPVASRAMRRWLYACIV
jgi:hypothetical protein